MRTKFFVCIAALFLSVASSFAQEDSSYMVTTSPLTPPLSGVCNSGFSKTPPPTRVFTIRLCLLTF